MGPTVRIGASTVQGVEGVELLRALKLGDFMLTKIPLDFEEALAVATACREHDIAFAFSEFFFRGSFDLLMSERRPVAPEAFFTRQQLDAILEAGGPCYRGRMTLGEVGGRLYWPKTYVLGRATGNYEAFPPAANVQEACGFYLDDLRATLARERELSGGPLMDVDSSMTFKYHLQAGIDIPVIESMPGDAHLLYAALRGAARAHGCAEWGAHIAIGCYGGDLREVDRLRLQRWRNSLWFSYLAGATFIYPESGYFTFGDHAFGSAPMKAMRRILREVYRFSRIHTRPRGYPEARVAVVHGQFDGHPGLWNKYVWGQYHGGREWLHGPAEAGWGLFDQAHRKAPWCDPSVRGDLDVSGHPPCGQVDVAPAEAPLEVLRTYACLLFLGWNTMTEDLYEKLLAYVRAGGHLVMALPHLSTETDRAAPAKLFRDGDVADLFGVRVTGRHARDVTGVRFLEESALPGYRFFTRHCDMLFLGERTPARVELAGARVLAGVQHMHRYEEDEVRSCPLLTEHAVGAGTAHLLTAWEEPGAPGMRELATHLLWVVMAGEQDALRVVGSDAVRHAVYPAEGYRVAYLHNTDPDQPMTVALHLGECATEPVAVPPADVRLAYAGHDLLLLPGDRNVELETWTEGAGVHRLAFFALEETSLRILNAGPRAVRVDLGESRVEIPPGAEGELRMPARIQEERAAFYASDFLDEPDVAWTGKGLPY